jgi:hypothetical protein
MVVHHSVFEVIDPYIKPFVSDYFVFEFKNETRESFRFKVPPTGFPTLLFCFGNKVNFFRHQNLTNESIVVGQLSKHINLHPVNGAKIFGVNFKPYGFYNLLGVSPKGIFNGAMESKEILGENKIQQIELCLRMSDDFTVAIDQIESMLLGKRKSIPNNNFLDGIVDEIVARNGLVDPYALVDEKISVRSFQRYFNEVTGINPKVFCQVLRHKYILQLMYGNPELKWNEMVLEGFYYDYSHFQKDFIKFTDVKPIDYLQLKNPFAEKLV